MTNCEHETIKHVAHIDALSGRPAGWVGGCVGTYSERWDADLEPFDAAWLYSPFHADEAVNRNNLFPRIQADTDGWGRWTSCPEADFQLECHPLVLTAIH